MNAAFKSIAEAVVPETAQLDEGGWLAFDQIVAHALAQRPAKMQKQLGVFVKVLNLLAIARHGRPLHKLPLDRRTQFLKRIEDSPLLLIRRGFWGVRTLILMGYYARPEARELVGYRGDARGWQARV